MVLQAVSAFSALFYVVQAVHAEHQPDGQNDAFQDAGDADTPPDSIEFQHAGREDGCQWNPKCVEYDSDQRWRQCSAQSLECSGGCGLCAHKKL